MHTLVRQAATDADTEFASSREPLYLVYGDHCVVLGVGEEAGWPSAFTRGALASIHVASKDYRVGAVTNRRLEADRHAH